MLLPAVGNTSQQLEPAVLLIAQADIFYITSLLNQIIVHSLRKLFITM